MGAVGRPQSAAWDDAGRPGPDGQGVAAGAADQQRAGQGDERGSCSPRSALSGGAGESRVGPCSLFGAGGRADEKVGGADGRARSSQSGAQADASVARGSSSGRAAHAGGGEQAGGRKGAFPEGRGRAAAGRARDGSAPEKGARGTRGAL